MLERAVEVVDDPHVVAVDEDLPAAWRDTARSTAAAATSTRDGAADRRSASGSAAAAALCARVGGGHRRAHDDRRQYRERLRVVHGRPTTQAAWLAEALYLRKG